MLSKSVAVVGLIAAVIGAAGAGAYLAVRQNAAEQMPVAEQAAASPETDVATAEPAPAVDATEQVVDAPAAAEPQTSVPPAEPAIERTAEPPAEAPAPTPEPVVADEAFDDLPVRPTIIERATPEPESTVADAQAPAAATPPAVDLPVIEGWEQPAGTESAAAVQPGEALAALDAEPIPDDSQATRSVTVPEPGTTFSEFEIAADAVIGLQIENGVSTRTAKVEDRVEARVTRDVLVAEQVVVAAGTRVLGSVVLSEQGGKLLDASRLGVRFHTLVMADGYRVPMVTETIYREGESRGKENVAKIGGAAVGGAILGAILGGGRGAAIGGSIGAAGGTAAAMGGDAEPAGLPPGIRLTVRLSRPVIVSVEQ